jgi:DNA topoisomerase-1
MRQDPQLARPEAGPPNSPDGVSTPTDAGRAADAAKPLNNSDPHIESAKAAGLTYVTDAEPGISRKGSGRGFAFYDPDGRLIRDRGLRRRLKALAIPPAWSEVWICSDPNGHLQVTARDNKGRKQYRYHPRFREVRDESKFGRMLAFSEVLPLIRERVEQDLSRRGLHREKVLATVVWLLERTLFRVGNVAYARNNRSYGLTTLKSKHVTVRGASLRFEFRGKSGVTRSANITDRRIARIVQRCQELPGQELFKYLDDEERRQAVDSGDINEYLRQISGQDVTAKDFRTWAGTISAAMALSELGPATSERETKKNVVQAVDQVADRLGNTRAVCRKYYVHPAVLDAYERGLVMELPPAPPAELDEKRERPSAALRREEAAVLQFLQRVLEQGPRTG